MKIIDARSGLEVALPFSTGHIMWAADAPTANYGDGESMTILAAEVGVLSARAKVRMVYKDFGTGKLVTDERWSPLTVRYLHPAFMLQKVAFVNT